MSNVTTEETGPYAGWMRWAGGSDGRFPDVALGPIYWREEADGVVAQIETERRHTNPGDIIHGGFLMSFADMALYAIAWRVFAEARGATVSCHCDFLGPAKPGAPLTARGEIVQETGKTLFIRALVSQSGQPVLSFSGVVRKIRPPS